MFTIYISKHEERDCNLNPNLLGKPISCKTTFKKLGVVFDGFMTCKAHADYVCKKVASRVSILGRVRGFVTKEAATLVRNALILPLFACCVIAWSNLLQQDIDRLQEGTVSMGLTNRRKTAKNLVDSRKN